MYRQSIITKITLVTSGIVSVLLVCFGYVLIAGETSMIKSFMSTHLDMMYKSIDEREHEELFSLKKNVMFQARVISRVSYKRLYDMDTQDTERLLIAYLEYPEMIAIQILDEYNEPYLAAWKDPSIRIGKSPPLQIVDNSKLFVQADSIYNDKKVGSFKIYYTESFVKQKIQQAKEAALAGTNNFHISFLSRMNSLIFSQSLGGIIIIIVQVICLVFGLRGLIIKPLSGISDIAQRLADYDLTVDVKSNRTDEIGQLLQAIEEMVLEFRTITSDVINRGHELTKESGNIVQIALQLESNSGLMHDKAINAVNASEQITDNINTMAKAAKDMNKGVKRVNQNAEFMTKNIHTVASSIEQMSVSMVGVGKIARQGAETTEQGVKMAEIAQDTMRSLGDVGNKIGQVTEVIKRIADKTNMLALNATIEAASAGTAGKGFNVVANQVKELAHQSSEAAQDIAIRVNSVQSNSEQAIHVIGDISQIIINSNKSSKEILSAIDEQAIATNEIASNASQVHIRANEIAVSTGRLFQSANEVAHHATEAAGSYKNVKEYINTVNKGVEDNNLSISSLTNSANSLAQFANSLQALVNKFRIEKGTD